MVKFRDFSRPLSAFQDKFNFQGLFKTVQSCVLKYFSSLCEPLKQKPELIPLNWGKNNLPHRTGFFGCIFPSYVALLFNP